MNKYLVVILIAFGLTSCNEKNEQYYLSKPKELQQALAACPNKAPEGLSCEQMEALGLRMNVLVTQLQSGPQAFGNKILLLQQTIANQQSELKNNDSNQELRASLAKNEHDLADYMVVVKWLESPEG